MNVWREHRVRSHRRFSEISTSRQRVCIRSLFPADVITPSPHRAHTPMAHDVISYLSTRGRSVSTNRISDDSAPMWIFPSEISSVFTLARRAKVEKRVGPRRRGVSHFKNVPHVRYRARLSPDRFTRRCVICARDTKQNRYVAINDPDRKNRPQFLPKTYPAKHVFSRDLKYLRVIKIYSLHLSPPLGLSVWIRFWI